MRSRPFLAGLLVILAFFTWTGTVSLPAEAQAPKRGGTLRVSYGNEIAHLDFHTAPGAGQALLENPEVKRLYLGYGAAAQPPRGDETARGDAIPGPGQTAG